MAEKEREKNRETSEELKMFFIWVWVMTTHVYPCAKIHPAVSFTHLALCKPYLNNSF